MSELRDSGRVIWLMLCIVAIIVRRLFIRSPLAAIYWKHRGLRRWRQMREIYAKHGIELRVP